MTKTESQSDRDKLCTDGSWREVLKFYFPTVSRLFRSLECPTATECWDKSYPGGLQRWLDQWIADGRPEIIWRDPKEGRSTTWQLLLQESLENQDVP
jgi:hypothetical protein